MAYENSLFRYIAARRDDEVHKLKKDKVRLMREVDALKMKINEQEDLFNDSRKWLIFNEIVCYPPPNFMFFFSHFEIC